MPAVPRGTVTFLFTDIEGSTVRWERDPAAMRAALARHDTLLHAGITTHGGVVVTERGEGDSFFALFARASDAVAAACAVQRALNAEAWPSEVAPLQVRMALHTGDAGLWEGRDYRGAAVNRCARLRAVAHGGQVLLSSATYALVRDHLPSGVTVRDLGEHRLRDLMSPEHIVQLVLPGLPADFPPLQTLDRQRHNLPVQPTALIGREREVAEVGQRLRDPQTRLLTLTGPGGTGKTRLALQVAAEVVEAFPDGVFFVNLAPLSDPALVLPTVAQTLGVVEAGSQPLRASLHAVLQDKQLLLVLDNFEQILEAASVVSEFLAVCAGVRVLVTSRAALRLRGERLYAVPPLALPDLTPLRPLETLAQYEAVRLFIERARDVLPDFSVTDETAPAVAEICVRLDGLPLAIELAAARVRVFTPPALLSRLEHRFGVLTGGARDLPARQRTLRATIDWSYSLLSGAEQTLFARLSVFVGGRTLEAIEAVCNPDGALDVLAGVDSLLEKSLLGQRVTEDETRFSMLETLHAYARDRLEESGEGTAVRQRHAQYFLALAETGEQALRGRDQIVWLRRLTQEHDNLRAAVVWAQSVGDVGLGLRLAGALWQFWWMRGYLSEGRRVLEELLVQDEHRPEAEVPARARARALTAAAMLSLSQGDFDHATAWCMESRRLGEVAGDKEVRALAACFLGIVAQYQGAYARATALYQEGLALFEELGDAWGRTHLLNDLGEVARLQGDDERATSLLQDALALNQGVGDRWGRSFVLYNLGEIARRQGDTRRARALLEESVRLSRALGDRRNMLTAFMYLGGVALTEGDAEQAMALYQQSLALSRTMGNMEYVAESLEGLAGALWASGDPAWAARLLGAAATARTLLRTIRTPSEQRLYEPRVQAIRAALGDEAFARAWAAGAALSLGQALDDALAERGEPHPHAALQE